jgi:hypothetical protein
MRRRSLSLVSTLFGLICVVIALAHIAIGPHAIPGAIPVNPTMDSEDRFYATLFFGFGAAIVWCSRDIGPRRRPFGLLLLIFFLGGIARLISVLQVGWPTPLFIFLGSLELILPLLFWWWARDPGTT